MLRHYDSLGLVRPTGRTVGGYREYSAEDIRRIFHVESLRTLGLSLREIGRALEDPAFTPSALVGDLIRRTEDQVKREQELLERLRTVDASTPSDWEGVLRIVELLHGLNSPSASRRQQTVLSPADDVPVPTDVLAAAVLAESDPIVAGALRWALARAGDDGVASVAAGVTSNDVAVRRRAVLAIAELPESPAANAALADALGDTDATVRRHAALTAGKRGARAAVPILIRMVVEGTNDVEASEILGTLASDNANQTTTTSVSDNANPTTTTSVSESADRITTALVSEDAEQIVSALVDELDAHRTDSAVRIRLAQALAELPGSLAKDALEQLTRDGDRSVALIATAFLRMLEERLD